jgi:hypothetical protein
MSKVKVAAFTVSLDGFGAGAMSPIFLGEEEHLFAGLNLNALGFTSIKPLPVKRQCMF